MFVFCVLIYGQQAAELHAGDAVMAGPQRTPDAGVQEKTGGIERVLSCSRQEQQRK